MKMMDKIGMNAQINAAFRQDVWFPKKYTNPMPKAAAILADAVKIPRMLGSLWEKYQKKNIFFKTKLKRIDQIEYL